MWWNLTLNHQNNTIIGFLDKNSTKKRYYTRNWAPYPASMFDSTDMMQMATKSTLNNDLHVNVSGRLFGKQTTVIYDVSNEGTLGDFIVEFKIIVKHGLTQGNVVLVFDGITPIVQNHTCACSVRKKHGGCLAHILNAEMPLPPKTSILGVTKNKVHLNKMLAGDGNQVV